MSAKRRRAAVSFYDSGSWKPDPKPKGTPGARIPGGIIVPDPEARKSDADLVRSYLGSQGTETLWSKMMLERPCDAGNAASRRTPSPHWVLTRAGTTAVRKVP